MSPSHRITSRLCLPMSHRLTNVPAALLGGAATVQSSYLIGEPYFTDPVAGKYYLLDSVGGNHAGIKTPCLRNAASVANYCSVGLFQLDGNFTISCWVKYEGSNTIAAGPMFFGGGDQATGADYRAHVWYRPSTGVWTFAVDGGATRATTTNTVLEDNKWHRLQVSRVSTTYKITVDGTDIVSSTGTVTRFTLRQIMQTYSSTYSVHGMMADFRVIDAAGVTWYFPLQDGEGDGTNRNVSYCKSDGTGGVITNAISGGTVTDWWAAKCPGYAEDWCIKYGGKLGSNGEFVPGLIGGSNAADGAAKTLSAGKHGNPFSSINLNPSWTNALMARSVPTELKVGQNINDQIVPFESAFNRRGTDGDDRIVIYGSAISGSSLDTARLYTDTSAPTDWTLGDLPGEIATEYFAAVAANSGTISSDNQDAVSNLLNGLHTAGLFDDVLALYLFHGNHLNAARLNVMNPTTVDGSGVIAWSGSPTLNASGGITPSVGNYGIGPHPHTLGLYEFTSFGGAGIGFYSTSNAATSERTIGNTTAFYLAPKYSSTSEFAVSNGTPLTGTVQDLSGFHFITREPGTDNIAAYRNGTSYATGTRTFGQSYGTASDAGKLHIGGCNNNGSGNLASTTPIRLAIITKGLLAAQVSALNTLVSTYISELV